MVVLGASESRDLRAAWKEYTRKVFPHAFTQIRNFLLVSISEGRSFDDVDWTLVSESGKSKRTMNLFVVRIKATICEDWWFLLQHRTVFSLVLPTWMKVVCVVLCFCFGKWLRVLVCLQWLFSSCQMFQVRFKYFSDSHLNQD